uniref:HMG box domain-containing protein n=1 Tax=Nelumbo nucifera TaxID=4432 RepID=A0A822XW15_NELNU|nr:TPA_asm: hypothetical protein HUJ06_024814 [Nelumbo nucifera]
MRGPMTTSIANKKPDAEMLNLKNRKTSGNATVKKEKSSKKDTGAPKRPAGAFFIFMEEFRKAYKENFPDNKSISAVGKAGGEKWKSMSDSEKAPYVEKAAKRKADYGKAMEEFKNKLKGIDVKDDESDKSTSEVHDDE